MAMLELNHQPWWQRFYSVIHRGTQCRQEEEICWLGCYISSPNFKFNFTSPAIYLSCQPRAPSVPSPLTLRSGLVWNVRCSPEAWLLLVMVAYNWISWVLGELLYILTPLGPSPTVLLLSCPPSSPHGSFFLFVITLLWEFVSSWPRRKLFFSDSNSFRETFGGVL